MSGQQSVVVRGEDRTLILRMLFLDTKEPFDLVDWSNIVIQFRTASRGILEKNTNLTPAVFATANLGGVNFSANTGGVLGNAITLVFDGVQDADSVVTAWNAANPLNGVSHDGVGTEVLSAGNLPLIGGRDSFRDVEVINETLGKVSVRLLDSDTLQLKTGPNQNIKAIVDKGAHPNGNRRIILFESVLTVINAEV